MRCRAIRSARLESSIETAVVRDVLKHYGLRGIKMKLNYDAGWPDRLFLFPGGDCFWIEFKQPGEPLRKKQEQRINWLIALGHDVEVHTTYDDAMRAISERVSNALCS